jgi:hypothetical protein
VIRAGMTCGIRCDYPGSANVVRFDYQSLLSRIRRLKRTFLLGLGYSMPALYSLSERRTQTALNALLEGLS